MPGLVGIIGRSERDRNRRDLCTMVSSMQHETFYSSGTYIDEEQGIYLGWTCHKGSYCDFLPVMNREKTRLLFFYGENHSHHQGQRDSNSRGAIEENHGVKLLLDLYEHHGPNFVTKINGWFHGVLVDLKEREILLFNDRYGIQRLYYYDDGDAVLFSAEAKAILQVRRELRQLEPRGVGEYLACDCVLENRSLFRNIFILPGGSLWAFRRARLWNRTLYFEPKEWENQGLLSEEEIYRKLEDQLPAIISRYFMGRLPIGVSLSAGLDSRLIMASIDDCNGQIQTYSFDGMYRESFDAALARQVAAVCGKAHTKLVLDQEYLRLFPKLAEQTIYISDGCLSAGSAYELYLNKLARTIGRVRVTGSYGSEVLRGVRTINAVHPGGNFVHSDFQIYLKNAINTFEKLGKCHDLTFSVFRQASWYGYGRISIEQSQLILRTPYTDNDLVQLFYRAPEAVRSNSRLQWYLIEQMNRELVNIPTDRGLYRRSGPFASRMAYLKSYFLLKADYYYKSGMPNWLELIHYMLAPLPLDKFIIGRHRFYHNRIWFRNELAPYLKSILLDPMTLTRPYINGKALEAMVLGHIKGDKNYTAELDKALTIELIHRSLLNG